ncbi:MAG: 3-(methylthio)propionyl-CoA ligase [Pseudomonadota bacterium]
MTIGMMQDHPLIVSSILDFAERWYPDVEIVSRTVAGDMHRYTYRDAARRSRTLANALAALGIGSGDKVGTLAWNGYRHLECYYAIAGMGAVLHTVNPRLFPEQVVYIVNHGEDKALFLDTSFLPLVESIRDQLTTVEHIVLMCTRAEMPDTVLDGVLCYEDLLDAADDDFAWPDLDERTASALCYTSGTTGNPKGVLYSHRSMVLHALAEVSPNSIGFGATDTALIVVPQFHVFAWGTTFAALMSGTKIVYPGPHMDGESVTRLLNDEACTVSLAVPTIWMMLMAALKASGEKLPHLQRVVIGGSACPEAMIRTFEDDYGVTVLHAWGMTETGPLGSLCHLEPKHGELDATAQMAIRCKQGKPVYGIDLRIVDESGAPLPHDGEAFGQLQVRGHWVTSGYYMRDDDDSVTADGWFNTGDVATIDPDGYMQITDRTKDVIKSGGEWISSIDLENIAVGHAGIAEAAVIAVPHPKWDERPLVVAVRKPGVEVSRDELLAHIGGAVARWQIPDDVVFVDALPHGATGKLNKLALREQFQSYTLPTA